MGDRFFNGEHLTQKLNNTLCLYKGTPYYINTGFGDDIVTCIPLDGSSHFRIRYTDPDFDYTHIPLGYITVKDKAYYLAREPQRIAAQGLTPRAVRATPQPAVNMDHLIIRKEFISCVAGEHVTFDEAIKKLRAGAEGISISRHMAVQKQSSKIYMIDYRGRTIAISQNRGLTFSPVEHAATHLLIKRLRNHGVQL